MVIICFVSYLSLYNHEDVFQTKKNIAKLGKLQVSAVALNSTNIGACPVV